MCHTQAYDGMQDSGAPALVESLHFGLCAMLHISRSEERERRGPKAAGSAPNTPNGVYRLDTEAECRRIRERRQGLRFAAQVSLLWASAGPHQGGFGRIRRLSRSPFWGNVTVNDSKT
jgi:hypothetical protein